MKSRLPLISRRDGSALITTLLVIVVLTIIVTAFLQSMTVERQTARSYMNRYRADLAATAAQNSAIQMLQENFTNYPDSVTWWDPDLGGKGVGGTAISYYGTEAATDATKATPANSFYLPLVSGATAKTTDEKGSTIPDLTDDEPNLNSTTNLSLLENGLPWIGGVSGATAPTIRVPWVYLKDNDGKRTARYAFWVEDESFRVNINVAGKKARSDDSAGTSASEIPLQGALAASDINKDEATTLAGKIVDLRTLMGNSAKDQKFFSTSEISYADSPPSRDNYEKARFLLTDFSSGLNLSRTGFRRLNLNGLNATDSTKTTADDIEKDVNQIKAAINFPKNSTGEGSYDFGQRFYRTSTSVDNNSPVSDPTRREIYVTKIAANIRDYIDSDSTPTQLLDNQDGTASVVTDRPTLPVGGEAELYIAGNNDYWAVGKENVPRLTKTAVHVAQLQIMASNSTTYDIRISYYLEFWNMGTKDIVLGPAQDREKETGLDPLTFIRIGNQPGWKDTGTPPGTLKIDEGRDFEVPLSAFGANLRFPAGKLTVLTTDPAYAASRNSLHLPSDTPTKSVYGITDGGIAADLDTPNTNKQHYKGGVGPRKNSGDGYGGAPTLDIVMRPFPQQSPPTISPPRWDALTYVMLGDSHGILDSQRAAVPIKPGIYIDRFGSKNTPASMHFRGGTLAGNLATGYDMGKNTYSPNINQYGDPRTSMDTLKFDIIAAAPASQALPSYSHVFASWRDDTTQQSAIAPIYSVLGYARPISGGNFTVNISAPTLDPFDSRKRWDDAGSSLNLATKPTAELTTPGSVAVIADDKLKSIGELGHIYDPAFYSESMDFTTGNMAHGGGRSLRIGQSEMPRFTNDPAAQWDGQDDSASRSRAAWRLCDIFSIKDDLVLPGVINLNGVQRDNGASILAALNGFTFSGKDSSGKANDQGEPDIDEKDLKEMGKDLITQLVSYVKNSGGAPRPLRERGQLSELPFFNRSNSDGQSLVTGVDMNAEAGRTREQLFRRLVELTTTRGNIFTAYIVGQSLDDSTGVPRILSSVKRRVTFQLIPRFNDPKLDSNDLTFSEEDSGDVARRFKAPVEYAVKVLRVSN